MYIRPFTISRMLTVRLLPPGLAGGINGEPQPTLRSSGHVCSAGRLRRVADGSICPHSGTSQIGAIHRVTQNPGRASLLPN